jgi:hypothetical protein
MSGSNPSRDPTAHTSFDEDPETAANWASLM